MNTSEITIRSIQHYLYCPHRWGLIEINKCWAENVFVTKANLLHKRVHDPDRNYTLRGKKVFTSVPVYNDLEQYDLYGVVDCIEGKQSDKGVIVPGQEGKYELCIVEYKPTKPQNRDYNYDDLMQVFAQKICVDYVFHCDCDAVLYYADVKKRIKLPFKDDHAKYDRELREIILQMKTCMENGSIPAILPKQNCGGCSLKDLCMPPNSRMKRKKTQACIKELGEHNYEKTS